MSNINKFVNFLYFIICLIFIIFILLGEVNAGSIDQLYIGDNVDRLNNTVTMNSNSISTDFTFTNKLKLNNYDSIEFFFATTLLSTNYSIGIDFNATCNNTEAITQPYLATITYADGSQAKILYSDYEEMCSNYNISNGSLSGIPIETTDISIQAYITNDTNYGGLTFCKVDNINGLISCPITSDIINGGGIKKLYLNLNRKVALTHNWYIAIRNMTYLIKDDTQAIINNNNNNTQSIINSNSQINNSIQDTNNTLKDSSIDNNNTSSSTSAWNSKNASNGSITNLLTLPIQLMQGYVNGMNSSCTPFNLGNLFGTTIILPCINVGNLIGSSLWSVIDVLFSGFMIFGIAKKLIKIFNDFTNMKSNQVDELYGGGA